jgi:hypothetical protein
MRHHQVLIIYNYQQLQNPHPQAPLHIHTHRLSRQSAVPLRKAVKESCLSYTYNYHFILFY